MLKVRLKLLHCPFVVTDAQAHVRSLEMEHRRLRLYTQKKQNCALSARNSFRSWKGCSSQVSMAQKPECFHDISLQRIMKCGEVRALRCPLRFQDVCSGRRVHSKLKDVHLFSCAETSPPVTLTSFNIDATRGNSGGAWYCSFRHVIVRPATKAPARRPHVPQPLLHMVRHSRASLALYGL